MALGVLLKSHALHETIGNETNYIISSIDDDYFEDKPCLGRVFCFFNACGHAVSIAIRPIIYLIQSIVCFFFIAPVSLFIKDCDSASWVKKAGHSFANVFISPFGQLIKTFHAIGGVVSPEFYYDPD